MSPALACPATASSAAHTLFLVFFAYRRLCGLPWNNESSPERKHRNRKHRTPAPSRLHVPDTAV